MLRTYKSKIIFTFILIACFILFDLFFLWREGNRYRLILDIIFIVFISFIACNLVSNFDKSRKLVTDLSNSEAKYKKLLNVTQYVFDNLNEAVYMVNKNGILTLLNPAWEKLTGFSVNESIGRHISDFIYPEDKALSKQLVSYHLRNNKDVIHEEIRLRKKDGGFVWVQKNTKILYDENKNVESLLGTIKHITNWKTSQNELLQINEDLAMKSEKLQTIAQMSAAIAHEVRNPLTTVSGFLHLMEEEKKVKQEYLDVIKSEIKRIELVLTEMLLLAKPQAVTFKKVNLVQTLEHIITFIKTEANINSIDLISTIPESPIWIYGEENQLKQVFLNILKNALEAMKNGGRIHIYHAIDVDHVSVYIKDEGVGIPEETMKKIGQPFYTTKEKGTGLGLTVCYKSIENHKGKIHISSQVGVGTTFEIILPLYKD